MSFSKSIFLIFLMYTSVCQAHISVSPYFLTFDANTGKRTELVRFTNTNSEETTYRIGLINYRQMSDGRYQEIKNPSPTDQVATPYLKFAPHEATLKPMQTQVIRVQRRPMAAALDGEYVSHLYIREMPPEKMKVAPNKSEGLHVQLKALYRVTIPVIIEKGTLKTHAWIESASVKKIKEKKYAFVVIRRTGTKSFLGTITVQNHKKEIGKIRNFRVFADNDKRILMIPLSQKKFDKSSSLSKNNTLDNLKVILTDSQSKEIIDEKDL